jgi:hypothetical protein
MEGSELDSEEMRQDLAEASSAKHMMEKILNLDQKTQLTIVMLLWLWWNERNKWRENHGRDRLPDGLPDGQVSEPCLLPDFRQKQHWSKQQCGTFKVNSDGAFDRETGSGSWGFIT